MFWSGELKTKTRGPAGEFNIRREESVNTHPLGNWNLYLEAQFSIRPAEFGQARQQAFSHTRSTSLNND